MLAVRTDDFETRIDAWVANALRGGPCRFGDLVSRLPGVFPTKALDALQRLASRGHIPLAVAQQLAQQARNGSVRSVPPVSSLPLPHPLDFEWRFTSSAANELLEMAVASSRSNEPILLLGTPSVAAAAIDAPVARHIQFVGGDNSVTRCIAAANAAAGQPISISSCRDWVVDDIAAAVVVLDPPWYLDFIRPMLAMAATACRPGGTVLISLPPMGTRASAEDDRQKLLSYACRLSLSPIETEHGRLAYDMPFFERNALTATGMNQIPADWRRGDLVVQDRRWQAPEEFYNRADDSLARGFHRPHAAIRTL